jgi:hypothetical protein
MTHRRLCTVDTASSSLTIADHAANDDVPVLPVHQEVVNEFVVDDEVIVHNDANEDENDDNDIVGDDDEINDERLEFSEDIALYVNERETLRYRTKFMKWGLAGPGGETMNGKASSYNAAQVVTLRFLQTLETGDSLSLQRQQGILDNARRMGGQALLLNPDIRQQWDFVCAAHEKLTQARGRRHASFPVPLEIQALLGPDPPSKIAFNCEDVMLTIIRLLVLNPFNDEEHVQLHYEDSEYYDDYCTGERWKRVMADLKEGRCALFFTLFIDGLIQDKGGFVTAKGCVLTMANFRWYLRGASSSKAGLCVFPDVQIPKRNRGKSCIIRWKKQLFHDCIAFLLLPAHEFNARGGACLPLHQTCYHFERVVLLALITDAPEGRDLGGSISACHHCFCPKKNMGDVEAATEPRTTVNMASEIGRIKAIIKARVLGTLKAVRAEARTKGLSLNLRNGFDTPAWCKHSIFGVDELVDHIHGALPQGMLHGLHEGLVKYAIKALLETAIASCIRRDVFNLAPPFYEKEKGAKDIREGNRKKLLDYIDDALREFARSNARCSDLELLVIGKWQYFSGGVTDGLVGSKDKRLNGMVYWTMLRQIHVALAGSKCLTKNEKIQLFGMCDLCYQVIELVHNPVPKEGRNGGENFQVVAKEFTRQLILCWMPYSKSKCQSIKWHLILHWLWYLKQIGGFSDERTLEKELGILFKKPYRLTNHHSDYNDQMATRTSLKQVVYILIQLYVIV